MNLSFSRNVFCAVLLLVSRLNVAASLSWLDDDDWFQLVNHAGEPQDGCDCASQEAGESPNHCPGYNFCATVVDDIADPDTYAVLDTCLQGNVEEGWRTWTAPDGKGFLFMLGNSDGYSENESAICMQAGYGDTKLGSRAKIRLVPCDIDSPLQRFVWKDKDYDEECENEGGKIRLQIRKELCLTWSGANDVKPGKTPVIVMPCADAKGIRANGWSVR